MHGLILRVIIPLGICLPHPGHTEKGNAPPLGSHGKSRLFVVSEEDFTTHPIQMTEYSDLAHNLFLSFCCVTHYSRWKYSIYLVRILY